MSYRDWAGKKVMLSGSAHPHGVRVVRLILKSHHEVAATFAVVHGAMLGYTDLESELVRTYARREELRQ
jgi:hypothetical protein